MTGKDLSATLERVGVSQVEFANQIGYTAETISRMINGRREIPRSVAIAARVLDLLPHLRERLGEEQKQHRGAWLEGYATCIEDVAGIFEEIEGFTYPTPSPPEPMRRPAARYGK